MLGAIFGSIIGFWIGDRFGYPLLLRYGSYIGLTETRIKVAQYLFRRQGMVVVLIARFVAVLRYRVVGFIAGANRMPFRKSASAIPRRAAPSSTNERCSPSLAVKLITSLSRLPGSLLPAAVSQWIPETQAQTRAKRRIGGSSPSSRNGNPGHDRSSGEP